MKILNIKNNYANKCPAIKPPNIKALVPKIHASKNVYLLAT